MAGFLTDAWVDELAGAARRVEVPPDLHLTVQQVVVDADGRERCYAVSLARGVMAVTPGRHETPDATLTQDLATALAIHRGELSAQTAFLDGRLRLAGDVRAVRAAASALARLDDVFAACRA